MEAGKLTIELVDFNIYKLVEDVVSLMEITIIEKNVELIIEYDKELGEIFYGDTLRISQILTNLLSNAVKFTENGTIILHIKRISSSRVHFSLKDSGIGMSQEQMQGLFEAFSQADTTTTRRFGGTGLGLSISKKLIILMNGTIEVKSSVGEGSEFSFEIDLQEKELSETPLALQSLNDSAKKIKNHSMSLKEELTTLRGSRILLVEDYILNQEIILNILEPSGIIIDLASNGLEAVEKFKQREYELVLMDIQMPIMDGYEASKIIRVLNSSIPIVALSANAMVEDIQKSKESGMSGHITKPIDIEELYRVLLEFLSKKTDVVNIDKLSRGNDIVLPDFEFIDSKVGLSHMDMNRELYLKILHDFKIKYSDINLRDIKEDEFNRTIHTLKGMSGTIGANTLHNICLEISYSSRDKEITSLEETLALVLADLQDIEKYRPKKVDNGKPLGKEKRVELLSNIKKFALKNRNRGCKESIKELQKYTLSSEETLFFERVEKLINSYEYVKLVELIDKE
jgi:CheY-like chemotaxis protein